MDLILHRYTYLPDMTVGRLHAGSTSYATIERPWLANPAGRGGVRRESCVPDGEYRLVPHDSARFPGTYALINPELGVWHRRRPAHQAWGRTAILVHAGNRVRDVVGCIALGMSHGRLDGERAVVQSQAAMRSLREALGRGGEHRLIISALMGATDSVE